MVEDAARTVWIALQLGQPEENTAGRCGLRVAPPLYPRIRSVASAGSSEEFNSRIAAGPRARKYSGAPTQATPDLCLFLFSSSSPTTFPSSIVQSLDLGGGIPTAFRALSSTQRAAAIPPAKDGVEG